MILIISLDVLGATCGRNWIRKCLTCKIVAGDENTF